MSFIIILIQNLAKSLILVLKKNATITNTYADKNLSAMNHLKLILNVINNFY